MVILMYAHKTKPLILNTVYCFQGKNWGNLAYHSGQLHYLLFLEIIAFFY